MAQSVSLYERVQRLAEQGYKSRDNWKSACMVISMNNTTYYSWVFRDTFYDTATIADKLGKSMASRPISWI